MTVERETFKRDELAICLSHYDLGVIRELTDFPRGSRRSPKIIIETDKGKFLLKRRAKGKEDLPRVGFTHRIQLMLAAQNFPLPHLIGTRSDNDSMLIHNDSIYEMFEYIPGEGYRGSLDATFYSGQSLGLYHKLLKDFQCEYEPPTGSYHDAKAIHQAVRNTVGSLPLETRPPSEVLAPTVNRVEEAYLLCAEKVNELGLGQWETQIVHGDWHPGNMLFQKKRVVAVIDYDAARKQQRVIDFANGALQFSILGGGEKPESWPEHLDEARFKRFIRGYDSVSVVSKAELRAIGYLMCEAMIAEAVLPIAATGSFGRFDGFGFLQMIDKKVQWILSHLDELYHVLAD
jgi:homoserine kinase type II